MMGWRFVLYKLHTGSIVVIWVETTQSISIKSRSEQ